MTGISRIVLYDPSPGGYLEGKHRYHVVFLANSADTVQDQALLFGFPLQTDAPGRFANGPSAFGTIRYVDYDFRARAKEEPRRDDLLLMPVPGLVFKQQWGPDHSKLEYDVLHKCVEVAKLRIVRKRMVKFTEDED
jgi:hypothetical protein